MRIHRGQDRALANEANTLVEMQPLSDKKSRSLACGTAVPCAIRLFLFLISLALIQSWPAAVCGQDQPPTAVKEISIDQLPNEARTTLRLIKQGGPFPYQRDGAVFGNFERRLPVKKRGYYREYTVPTLGRSDRGARRIVTGENGECYYTEDHYRTFRKIRKGLSG